jgi:TonB family protein
MTMHEIASWPLAQYIAQYAVNSLWQLPLLLAAALAASKIARRLGPKTENRLWLATLFLCVLVPLGGLKSNRGTDISLRIAPAVAQLSPSPANPALRIPVLQLPFGLFWIVVVAAAACFGIAAIRLGVGYLKARRLVRNSVPIELFGKEAEIWQRCRQAFATGSAALGSSSSISGPVTVGSKNPALLLPAGILDTTTRDDLAAALAHECAHLERKDFLWNLLGHAAALPVAFHPAVWIVKSRVAESRETICDRMAADRLAGGHAYAHSLLRIAQTICGPGLNGEATPYAVGLFDSNSLEKRIMKLMQTLPSTSRWKKIVLSAFAALILGASGIAAHAFILGVTPEDGVQATAAESFPGKVYRVGDGVSAPKVIYAPEAEFPAAERAARKGEKFQGKCIVGLVVDKQGHPQQVHIIRSLRPDFDAQAIAAVKQYRFKPGMANGAPVAVGMRIEVDFRRY